MVNVAVGKAIYWGHQADPDFPIDFAVHVHIAPSQGMPCFLDEEASERILAYFQPRLFEYRIRNMSAVRGSTLDFPELQAENRLIARQLAGCIVDAPEIQADVRLLLEDREHKIQETRLLDRTCVVIEVLLASCHVSHPNALLLQDVANGVQVVLKSRGETAAPEPRAIGAVLDDLGLPRKRTSRGYRILLTAAAQRQIHLLARDHDVESVRTRNAPCALCTELYGGSVYAVENGGVR